MFLGRLWPIGEQTDTEIQAQFGSAFERKAAISQPGVLISAYPKGTLGTKDHVLLLARF
jgi:hypothetical protein